MNTAFERYLRGDSPGDLAQPPPSETLLLPNHSPAQPDPSTIRRIPLDRLVWLGNVPAGMDWSVIGYWACQFRKSGEPGPPILVVPISTTGLYRVTDGRHRTAASYIAGRTEIVYELDPNRPAESDLPPL